jgi:DegV family protein with EDD domain
MARVAVITDSGTDVPAEFAREHDVRVAPLVITYEDGSYRSGIDITTDEVVARFEQEIPKTSTPSMGDLVAAIEQARDDGYDRAIIVTISSGLSGTYQAATLAAQQVGDFPVDVVDTLNIGVGAGTQAMAIVRQLEAGVDVQTILEQAERTARETKLYFSVRDLTYLRRGGRISETVYRLGSVLNIKPVITCDAEGKYAPVKKARGWEKAVMGEIEQISRDAAGYGKVVVGICCSSAEPIFDWIEQRLEGKLPPIVELIRTDISPDLVVHTGPSLVGMFVRPALPCEA